MKKILSFALVAVMVLSLLSLTSCGEDPVNNLKFGLGVDCAWSNAVDADAAEEKDGTATLEATAVVVLVDNDGKIVKCDLDTAQIAVTWTAEGVANAVSDLRTKYELGFDYHMVAYGGAEKEWFEQADAFCSAVAGKTITEVKAMVADGYGAEGSDIVTAGCTISVTEFVNALDKAVANAVESEATDTASVKVAFENSVTSTNAETEKAGVQEVNASIVATALDADGKVIVAKANCVQAKMQFGADGAVTTSSCNAKYELGFDYHMVAYGGAEKEWFEQADVLCAQLKGKTASEIAGLALDTGYGNDAVVSAGCTIYVTDLVKAAVKAATV